MKIEVVKEFNGYKAGQVFDWGDGMCRILIGRGMIREVRNVGPPAEKPQAKRKPK